MRICVVDDEPIVRMSIIDKLESIVPKADIYDVGFGTEALDRVRTVKPDLLFLDIRMPNIDGLEILKAVSESDLETKVVILTGYDQFEYARIALQHGAIGYLLKPAGLEELRAIVDKAIRQMQERFILEFESLLSKQPHPNIALDRTDCPGVGYWFDERMPKTVAFDDLETAADSQVEEKRIVFRFAIQFASGYVYLTNFDGKPFVFRNKRDCIPTVVQAWERHMSARYFGESFSQSTLKVHDSYSVKQVMDLRKSIIAITLELDKSSDWKLNELVDEWLGLLPQIGMEPLKKECAKMMVMLDEGLVPANKPLLMEEAKLEYWLEWVDEHKTWDNLREKIRSFIVNGFRALILAEEKNNRNSHKQEISWLNTVDRCLSSSERFQIGLEEIAAQANVHPVTLSRLFKQETGMSFVHYVTKRRLNKAKELLLNTNWKIQTIAEEVGYFNYPHFRNIFKSEFGCGPKEYREKQLVKRHGPKGTEE